jgi:uroporphyrinogen decarboxylase
MNSANKNFLRVLAGETLDPPPFWLMRQAGRYLPEYRAIRAELKGFLDLCYNPKKAVEVTLQPLRRYNFDAAILFSDILVVPHAMGQHLEFREGEGPVLEAITSEADIERLSNSNFHECLAPVYETVSRLTKAIPASTTLIGFAGAPWTVATYMIEGGSSRDFVNTKLWAYGTPDRFQRLIDLLVEKTSAYLLRQIDAGAEVVQLFDSWAGVLPEEEFRRWSIKPAKAIVERIHAVKPGFPIIGFPRGAGALYETYVKETGVSAVSLDTTVPLTWAAEKLQPHVAVQGNLDPIALVVGGDSMLAEIDRIKKILGRGRFIFNLGHGIIPQTPPENVALLAKRVRGE